MEGLAVGSWDLERAEAVGEDARLGGGRNAQHVHWRGSPRPIRRTTDQLAVSSTLIPNSPGYSKNFPPSVNWMEG